MWDLFGGVEADGMVIGQDDPDDSAILKRAELFQLFGLFKKSRGPVNELLKEIAPIAIEAHVSQRGKRTGAGPQVRNGATGEVEGISCSVDDDLYDVGVIELIKVGHRVGRRDHGKAGFGFQSDNEAVREGRVEQRLIPLNIDHMGNVRIRSHGLRNTIRSGGVPGRSHYNPGAEGAGFLFDTGIVSGDQKQVELFAPARPFVDVAEQALAGEVMKGFSGEAGGSPSGGDNTSDFGSRSLCRHLNELNMRLSVPCSATRILLSIG